MNDSRRFDRPAAIAPSRYRIPVERGEDAAITRSICQICRTFTRLRDTRMVFMLLTAPLSAMGYFFRDLDSIQRYWANAANGDWMMAVALAVSTIVGNVVYTYYSILNFAKYRPQSITRIYSRCVALRCVSISSRCTKSFNDRWLKSIW